MSHLDIYALTPVNKIASIVTSQSDLNEGYDEINSLRREAKRLHEWFHGRGSKKSKYKTKEERDNGKRLQEISDKINEIKGRQPKTDLGRFIIDVCKERMTKHEWESVTVEAFTRMKQLEIKDDCNNS